MKSPVSFTPPVALRCVAAVCILLINALALAQTSQAEREKTRQLIEQVTADQAGALDQVNSLGTSLSPALQAKQALLRQQAESAEATAVSTAEWHKTAAAAWPALNPPSQRRMLRRAPKDQTDNGLKVYTPDFSRQTLTMASLMGKDAVDLPDQALDQATADPVADTGPQTTPAFSLPDLVGVGLSYSPVLEQTQAQIDNALFKVKQTRAEMLPKASARFAKGREVSEQSNGSDNSHINTNSALRLTQPLVNVPVVREWMADLSNQQSVVWRAQAARETVALAVTNATLALAASRLTLEFADEQLFNFNELLNYVQTRTQSGISSQADLERTRTRVLLARQQRVEQQANYRNALLEVERLTGQKPASLQLPFLNQLPGLPATQGELRSLVAEQSFDLRTLREDIKAQEQSVSAQYNRYLPTVGLSLERDQGENIRGINPALADKRIMLVVGWETSLGGKEYYAAKGAQSELVNRQAKLSEETERVMQGIDADFALLQSASLRVVTGDAEQKAAAAVVKSVQEQLKSGRMGSLLEALDAFDRYFAARQRLAQTLSQQMQAQAQLLRRLGVLSQVQAQAAVQLETPTSK